MNRTLLLEAPKRLLLEQNCSFSGAKNIQKFLSAHHRTCALDKKMTEKISKVFSGAKNVVPSKIREIVVKNGGLGEPYTVALTDCSTASGLWIYNPPLKDLKILTEKLGWS